jgi:hypothetical protein
MRTTLTLDDDVLARARQLADATGASLGTVISRLARESLSRHEKAETRNGILLLPVGVPGTTATLEEVHWLRDEGP